MNICFIPEESEKMLLKATCDLDIDSWIGVCLGDQTEETFKQMEQVQMHRAMKGLGTDLGKSEMLTMVGAQGNGVGWRTIENWRDRLGPDCVRKVKEFRFNLVKTTTTITKGSPRVSKQYKDISDSFS